MSRQTTYHRVTRWFMFALGMAIASVGGWIVLKDPESMQVLVGGVVLLVYGGTLMQVKGHSELFGSIINLVPGAPKRPE